MSETERLVDTRKDKRAPMASNAAVRSSMQGNKGKDTKPELLLRQALRRIGLTGYRLHWKVKGKPDIAFPGKHLCVQVHGCFWHRCPHCNPHKPNRNTEFWDSKFKRTLERDKKTKAYLESQGWMVYIAWECKVRADPESVAEEIKALWENLNR